MVVHAAQQCSTPRRYTGLALTKDGSASSSIGGTQTIQTIPCTCVVAQRRNSETCLVICNGRSICCKSIGGIRVFSDGIVQGPYGRTGKVRFICCAVTIAYWHKERLCNHSRDALISRAIRHATNTLSVIGILEDLGLRLFCIHGITTRTIPGCYGCLVRELSSMACANRVPVTG